MNTQGTAKLAHTATPWYWHTDHAGRVSIRTPDRGNLIVMDFVRQGMNSAAPRFAHWEGMDLGAPRGRMGGILECSIDHPDAQFIVRTCNSHAQLVAALDTLEADAVNLHCALQSTAHMDPRDTRIAAITGQVVEDLLAMRDKARAALTAAQE